MSERDGGPAFPGGDFSGVQPWFGLSLRDWFAGQALVALGSILSRHQPTNGQTLKEPDLAKMAYSLADALLAERGRG